MGWLGDIAAVAAPAVGAYFGGPAGAAAGSAISGYLGTQSTNKANAERADAANAWSAQQYATRYQTMTRDLMAAGLNPMLAYSQSAGTAPTAQQVTFQNPVASATQAYQAVRGTEASATRDYASAAQAESEIKRIDQTVENLKEEFKNIPLKGNEINALVAKLAEEKTLLMRKGLNEIDVGNNLRQMGEKLKKETKLLDNQVEVEASLENLGRYSKELGPLAQLLLGIMRSK